MTLTDTPRFNRVVRPDEPLCPVPDALVEAAVKKFASRITEDDTIYSVPLSASCAEKSLNFTLFLWRNDEGLHVDVKSWLD